MLINCYDPNAIILAGYISRQFPDYFTKCIRERMETDVYDNSLRNIEIIPAMAGEDALIKGAAIATIREYLQIL